MTEQLEERQRELSEAKDTAHRAHMERFFPEAMVTDFERRVPRTGVVRVAAISFPDPPAGMTESNSATVQPQDGVARMMWTSSAPSL